MVGVELKKGLDPVDDGFNAGGCPSSKLERSKQTRDGARGDKAEG